LDGNLLLLIDAIISEEFVIIAGQASRFPIYTTNLYLVHAEQWEKLANG
jgi:lipid-A-disaccharide synthase-like uncharacterized protein